MTGEKSRENNKTEAYALRFFEITCQYYQPVLCRNVILELAPYALY